MEEHVSAITRWVNDLLGHYYASLIRSLHYRVFNPELPIPEYLVMSVVVVILGTIFALALRRRLSVERPGALQQVAELLLTNPLGFGIKDLLEENIGHDGHQFIAFTGSVAIFVLFANLLGIIPLFTSATGGTLPIVPLGCAILTFLHFNWAGLRKHGPLGYLKTFAGPVWWLSWLIAPVEIISATARILSLTVRLWANIFASDLIYVIFLGLLIGPAQWAWDKHPIFGVAMAIFPAFIAIVFVGLHIFVSIIQAYVFTVLPSIYLGQAVAEEH